MSITTMDDGWNRDRKKCLYVAVGEENLTHEYESANPNQQISRVSMPLALTTP